MDPKRNALPKKMRQMLRALSFRKPSTKILRSPESSLWMPRRDVFGWLAWGTICSSLSAIAGYSLRMLVPKVVFDPPSQFRAGFPEEYAPGQVSEKWKELYRTWIIRDARGIYALSAKCTHLGCTPNWIESEDKFKCPCHGSGYYRTGVNFEGPAPRPLERFRIYLGEDGQLVVDRSRVFRQDLGEWENPESFLQV